MRFIEILEESYSVLRQVYQQVAIADPKLPTWFTRFQPRKTKYYTLHFETIVDAFEYLVKNNLIISSPEKMNTQFWIKQIRQNPENAYELGNLVLRNLEFLEQNRKEKADANNYSVLYKDTAVVLFEPHSYAASKKLGHNTKWCTTSRCSDIDFRRFTEDGDLYYLHVKGQASPNHRLAVYNNYDVQEPEFFNAVDEEIGETEFVNILRSVNAPVEKLFKIMDLGNVSPVDSDEFGFDSWDDIDDWEPEETPVNK